MEPGFTLFAYETFFTSARAENYLFSMIHSVWAVAIAFVIGFPIAVFVRRRIPQIAQHRVILLFILPFMISELVRVFAMRPVLGRHGLINNLLMQFQADILGVPVVRSTTTESTALGAAYLAGLAVGFWSTPDDLKSQRHIDRVFEPTMSDGERGDLRHGWAKAAGRARHWIANEKG